MIKSSIVLVGKALGLLFLTTFIPFFLLTFLSSNPAEVALRVQAITPTAQNVAQKRHELGLDQPFFTRYFEWVTQALQGNFGTSYSTGKNVTSMILEAFPYTFFLTIVALFFYSCYLSFICTTICSFY